MNADEKRIIDLANQLGKISRKDVEAELNISQTMAGRILKSMVNKQLVGIEGKGKNTVYVFKK